LSEQEPKAKNSLRLVKKLLPSLFYISIVVFLFLYLRSIDFSKLKGIEVAWQYLLLSGVFMLIARYIGVFVWMNILKNLGAKNLKESTPQLTYVYAKSWLGRYIPGTAPWILGKIYFASKLGVSKNKLAVSSLLEGALQIVVVIALS